LIETGLGGRLDATNILQPEISSITSVSLDHVDILGSTVAEIAREKAGIIKEGVPVVMGELPPEAEAVVREVARSRNAIVHSVTERFGPDPSRYPETNLEGSFQRINAATALLAAEVLNERFPLDPDRCREALRAVYWPGRWQRIQVEGRSVILDSTHNPEGCVVLGENLKNLVQADGVKPDIAVGTLGEFRVHSLMETVSRYARDIYLLIPHQPRAATFEMMRSEIPDTFKGEVREASVQDLFPVAGTCSWGAPGQTLVVTGSIYLIGEVSDRLFHETPVDESILQDPIR
jgi:dihydrofolate synthase/folylpolyglutamate synthase